MSGPRNEEIMPKKDKRIAELVADRWQQYNAIRETETSPEAFIKRVSQLLNQWYLDDAPLLFSASDDEPRGRWFSVQADLHNVAQSASPRGVARAPSALGAGEGGLPV